jgi:hypothetical protein
MRMSAGVEAAMYCELAADGGRIVREVRSWNRCAVKSEQNMAAAPGLSDSF